MCFKTKLFQTERTLSFQTSITESLAIGGCQDFSNLKYLRNASLMYLINNSDILWQSFFCLQTISFGG